MPRVGAIARTVGGRAHVAPRQLHFPQRVEQRARHVETAVLRMHGQHVRLRAPPVERERPHQHVAVPRHDGAAPLHAPGDPRLVLRLVEIREAVGGRAHERHPRGHVIGSRVRHRPCLALGGRAVHQLERELQRVERPRGAKLRRRQLVPCGERRGERLLRVVARLQSDVHDGALRAHERPRRLGEPSALHVLVHGEAHRRREQAVQMELGIAHLVGQTLEVEPFGEVLLYERESQGDRGCVRAHGCSFVGCGEIPH